MRAPVARETSDRRLLRFRMMASDGRRRERVKAGILSALLLLLAAGLSATKLPAAVSPPQLPDPGDTGVSKQQQEQLGHQAANEVYKQMPVLPDSSPETQYVRQLGQKLMAVIPQQNSWAYEFHVVPQKEINAFALPGGPVFVNVGTLLAADNEAELAGVIAHEMSHVYMQHSIKQMKKAQWTQGIAGVLGSVLGGVGGTVGALGQLGIGVAGGALTMKYSREDEAQADAVGAIIMYKAGYDPRYIAQFFHKLASMGGSGPQFLSDHPNPGNREHAIEQQVQSWPPKDFVKDGPAFPAMRNAAMHVRTYSAQEIADGARSGAWEKQNLESGAMRTGVPAIPASSSSPASGAVVSAAAPAASRPPEASSAAPGKSRKLAYTVDVPGAAQWTDTAIEVVAGDRLTITADGTIQNAAAQATGPEGFARDWRDLLRALPVRDAGGGALIARIGDVSAAVPFVVGGSKEVTANTGGRLFLGINQLAAEHSGGSFHVSVTITPAAVSRASVADLVLGEDLASHLPRRVTDPNGKPGDLVNFVVLGSEERLKAAFQSAGWVQVDRTKGEAVMHAVLSSAAKQSYVEMPMSELYLFGRAQDFGFARAEPVRVVESRHHLRVWKAPFEYQGQTVWAGAATHDIGFEKDQRSGGVTHKIDPNVDLEREFVRQCFQEAGALSGATYLTPSDAVRDAQTATGGAIQSDGRVLALQLGP